VAANPGLFDHGYPLDHHHDPAHHRQPVTYWATQSVEQALAQARQELAERQRADQELQASQRRFQAAVENISDVIVLLTGDGRIIDESIELVTVLEPQLGQVQADPGQIEQLLLNLVVNARTLCRTEGSSSS
jgi:signal transduction histidine kinase